MASWTTLAAGYALVATVVLWPSDLRRTDALYVGLSMALFLLRTFDFHFGAALLVAAAALLWRRQWRLTAAVMPLAGICLAPTVSQLAARSPGEVRGETVRVMSVNLLAFNDYTEGIVGEIRSVEPDLLVLQEYNPRWQRALRDGLDAVYPHVFEVVRPDTFGIALFSRLPLLEPVEVLELGGSETPHLRAVVPVGGVPVVVYGVHISPPISIWYGRWQRLEMADLLDRLAGEKRPCIVAGDFNFTRSSPFGDALARLGFVDAHDLAGSGRGSTWNVRGFLRYLPGVRIDHLYLSPELTAVKAATGVGQGSDHRPIVAEIGVRGP